MLGQKMLMYLGAFTLLLLVIFIGIPLAIGTLAFGIGLAIAFGKILVAVLIIYYVLKWIGIQVT